MKYTPLPASVHVRNRDRLAGMLPAGSLVVIHSNDIYPTNADGTLPHHQNADLFYLTGVDQEESVLLMKITKEEHEDTLLLRETNEQIAIWEGARLTQEQGAELSGIADVRWTKEYDSLLRERMASASAVYVERNEHPRQSTPVQTRNDRYAAKIAAQWHDVPMKSVYDLIAELRQYKSPEELEQLSKACEITAEGFRALLPSIKPGMGQWELEARLSFEYLRRGARKFSFQPIISSGPDTCVLHYITNDKRCRDGELVLLDIGAEYGGYNGDMTRTVPANGRFTPRQRAVYDAVLHIHRHAVTILRPGIRKSEYERQMRVFTGEELLRLGLVTRTELNERPDDPPAVRRYFMHGTSHFLGLDVHDVGEENPIIGEGMVWTIEPGIYIREENLGIRLENDYYIGREANVNLLESSPIEPDEIESLMNT
ncbi:MAG: aminopeptidase P N-terminal domain-containing protein [Akkermansia sp.]|nr:aminopeptidase P N-terminal domain-containing protein [Akkermansia sp.]